MTVVDLLSLLEAKGISLALNGDQLAVRGDKKALADAGLVDLLRQKKAELIAFLQQGGQTTGLGGRVAVPPNGIPSDGSAERITPEMVTLAALTQDEIDALVAQVAGGTPNIQDIYPLAPLQEGMLFHHLVDPEHDAYVEAGLIAAPSRERLDSLLAAIQRVIDRHDILRTSLVWQGVPEPLQVVSRQARLAIEEIALDPSQGEAAAQLEARLDPRNTRFDLTQAPLIRAWVAEDARNGRWLLRILSHHLVLDHTTQDLLVEEAALIEAGRASELPAAVPFRNFVAQARLGVSEAEHEAFFTQMLGDIDEPTAPFGLLDVQGDGSEIEEAEHRVAPELAAAIRHHCRRLGVSAASLMHLAWSLVLARTTGREDVVFGTVLFGRMQGGEGADRVMGMFINTLPVRFSVDGSGVEAALRQTHARLAQLLRHEHAPLSLAQRCSAVEAPAPLFTALLNYRYSPEADEAGGDGVERAFADLVAVAGHERTNYPLTFSVDDLGEGFLLTAQVSRPLEAARVCGFMQSALSGLVEALSSHPQAPLSGVGVLPASERWQVVQGWNATSYAYPRESGVGELFAQMAQATPSALAVLDGERTLNYAELDAWSNRLAHALLDAGLQAGEAVALSLPRSAELVVAELAVLKAGGAYLPLDTVLPGERQALMAQDAGVRLLIGRAGEAVAAELSGLQRLDADGEALSSQPSGTPDVRTGGDALAYVMYTSGSTGRPKGVEILHRGIVRLVRNNGYAAFGADDRVALAANPAFDASTLEVWAALLNGGAVVVIDQDTLLDPQRLAGALGDRAVSVLWLTVGLFNQYERVLGPVLPGLRYLIIGGDALDPRVVRKVLREHRPQHLLNGYGPTESTTFAITHEIESLAEEAASVPLGRPIGNTRIYILDGHGQPVPIGVAGELYIGGDGVARGYLNQPELTAERFVADPFATVAEGDAPARMYRTGDLGRWLSDGTIEYLGRNDFQVKVRGFRIELGEIEAHLAQAADVSDVVVIARADGDTDTKYLVAYYVGEAAAEALRAHAGDGLPSYMVPSAFVRLARLPLTPNGKLDRAALPAPEGDAFVRRGYEAPQGDVEQTLARLWSELLGVAQVGRHDNFFELGGHSLLAVSLIERMRQAGLQADVRALFTSTSLAELAASVGAGPARIEVPPNGIPADGSAERITPEMVTLATLTQDELDRLVAQVPGGVRNIQDIYPLAPLQEGILFHHLMAEDGDPYLLPSVYGFKQREAVSRFVDTVQQVIGRHDILRTAVYWEGLSQPVQVVQREARLELVELDAGDFGTEDLAAALEARFDPQHTRLDLGHAPLLRAHLVEDARNGRWLLHILAHHLAIDHTTLDLLVEEAELIEQGREAELPAPVPFRHFVAQARLGVSQEEHEAFFHDMLGDIDEPTAPFGLLDVQGDGSGIEEARLRLDPALAQTVRAQARRLGVSAASLMHLAWSLVLARTTGREDVVFGTVLFGRMQGGEGADRVMGMFINTLPVRLGVGEVGVEAALRQTHARLAQLLRHEHAPLSLAQRCSAVDAPAPLFTSLLNYRYSPGMQAVLDGTAERDDEIVELGGHDRTNYPLTLSVDDLGQDFLLSAQAVAGLDPLRVCHFMQRALAGLADALARDPQRALNSLGILPEAERAQVVDGWNATHRPYALEQGTARLIEAQAARTPQAVALQQDETSLTYAELDARANRLAHHLRTLGVGPDVRVAVCLGRSVELVVAELAVLKAGGAYVPLDPAYPGERLAYMLEDCEPGVILTDGGLEAELQTLIAIAAARHEPALPVLDLRQDGAWRALPEDAVTVAGLRPHHLAYVIYTSGSTGRPKGVMIEQRSLNNLIGWHIERFGLEAGSRSSCTAGVAFDACAWETWPVLAAGGTLLLAPAASEGDPQALLAWWQSQALDVSFLVTPLAEHALAHGQANGGVRSLLIGGDRLRRWPSGLPSGQALVNNYGPTENTVVASSGTLSADGVLHIGRPIGNTRIYILDGHGQPVPIGVAGELYIGGDGVARGYLNQPELTAERFVADPFVTVAEGDAPARMYKTGDLGRWLSDGTIEYLGRNDFQVKVRGFRIELGEIEAHLAQAADVSDVVVIARADGDTDTQHLVAYYVGEAAAEALRTHAGDGLPSYMVPSAFVRLARLPLTPNGKLDRAALPAPEGDAFVRRGYEAPQGDVEQTLARLWSELLGVAQVGRHDNFFELGGHSLLAVQLVSRLRSEVALELSLSELFDTASLSELAARIEARRAAGEAGAVLEAIGRADRAAPLPLSLAQQRLWFLGRLGGASEAYHIAGAVALEGELDAAALAQALWRVQARHEALRTRFGVDGQGQPVQVIDGPDSALAWHTEDLSGLAGEAQDAALQASLGSEASAPFDLERGPLLRARLMRLGEGHHVLSLCMHHIISDGWSIGVLLDELSTQYGACVAGEDDPLPALAVQYADYAAWQRQWLSGGALAAQQAYWQATLAARPRLLSLPLDHARPAQQDYRGDTVPVWLPEALTQRLQALAQREGVTLYMVLLASWGVLLGRLAGQDEVVIGTPVAGRTRQEVEGLIGFFVNTLALPVDLRAAGAGEGQDEGADEGPDTRDLLARVKAQVLGAQAHQALPFEQVVDLVQPPRSLSTTPLFQAVLAWQNTPEGELSLPGLTLRPLASPQATAQFDLTLNLMPLEGGVGGGLNYATALWSRATMERMVGGWQVLLEAMLSQPEVAVSRLAILPEAERAQVVDGWNATARDYPPGRCLHELIEAQADRTPQAVAVRQDGALLTYAELNARANRLAHHLRTLGVGPDARVAVCLGRSVELVVALVAVLKAGGAYVPLDPGYPGERLAYMLEDCEPAVVISAAELAGRIGAERPGAVLLDMAQPSAWADASAANPEPFAGNEAHLAYVIYTSGSTGRPKAAQVWRRGLQNLLGWYVEDAGLSGEDRVLLLSSHSFDLTQKNIFGPLVVGGCLHLGAEPFDPQRILAQIEAEGITWLNLAPSAFHALIEAGAGVLQRLGTVVLGGEAVQAGRLQQIPSPRPRFINSYGPTECSDVVVWHGLEAELGGYAQGVPLGRPVRNTRLYVLDEHRAPVPIGVVGEIWIGGRCVGAGYLNQPELTDERFMADPFVTVAEGEAPARMYRTGDLGRWLADGTIEYLGRNDFQVKVRGFRIELGEIEAHLAQAADVSDVVVIARESGEGEAKHLVAYYVGEAAAEALRAHAGDGLPSYMVPSAFVRLARLPLTPNGKLDRAALPAPEGDAFVRRGYEAPQGEVEQTLARLWSELLGVAQVGRHDNFFELGGHSLLAVQLVSRLRSEVALELSLSELFDTASLSELAARIEARRAAGEAGAVLEAIGRADRAAPLPLSLAQQRLWFLGRLGGASEAYHIAGAVALEGELDAAALAQALWRVQARHEALRTRFGVDGQGQPVQVIDGPDSALAWHTEDLSGLAGEAQDAALQASLGSEASAPFDLERGPLLRARLMRLGEGHHVLSLCMHHIISDGWSIGVLLDELSTQYGACVAGEDDPLPALAVQYADYAAWQRQWLSGGALAAQQAYWQATLSERPRLLSLPLDHARPAQQDYRGDTVPVWLPEALTQRLQALAQREGVTLYMVLLASWGVLLGRLAGQDEVVIGTPVAGRTRQEVEGLIGFFVNTLALPVDLRAAGADEGQGEGPDTRDLLARVKAQVLGAQAHQALPFEQVVDLVQPPRSLSTTPLFQAVLAWQNTPEGELSLPGLTLRPLASPQATAQFDLTLNLMPLEGGVGGGLNYATALWSRATMERMMGGWQVLLEAMLSQPEVAVSRLAILPEAERAQVVDGWNATSYAYPRESGVGELFAQMVQATPSAPAVLDGERTLSYAELDAWSNRLAHALLDAGLQAGEAVALSLPRSAELVAAELAVLKAGGAYLPLDTVLPGERQALMAQDAGVRLLIGRAGEAAAAELSGLQRLDADGEALSSQPSGTPDVRTGGDALAYVMYTSGSTGRPKGVEILHRGIVRLVRNNGYAAFGADDRVALAANPAFDASTLEVWAALLNGGAVVVIDQDTLLDPQRLAGALGDRAVSVLWLTVGLFNQYERVLGPVLPGLRYLIIGGDALDPRVVRKVLREHRPQHLLNGYGPTESTTFAITHEIESLAEEAASVPLGRPIGNTRIYILDGHGQPVPIGVAGELYIGGDGVARGYLNQPELTAERFVADPFATVAEGDAPARMYRTGDLGRWLADGTIEYLGRNDFQVKVRGFRIELGEIEAHLAQAADVSDVVVIARADGDTDTKYLVAYYVGEAAAEALRAHAGDGLPSYMVPSAFVRLARLPLTPNGKLDRAALPAPEGDAFVRRGYEAPQGDVEQTLARLWSELLGVEPVGRHDNFFELGGHSLLAVSLIERMRQAGLQADVRALFTSTSLAELAASVGAGPARIEVPPNGIPADGSAERITPEMVTLAALTQDELDRLVAQVPGGVRNVQDIYPLAPLQEGILFHHLMAEDGDPYLLPSVYGFRQREAVSRFVDTVQQVIGRHDILRTAVYWEGLSQPVQVVQREARLELVELDAEEFGTAELAAALEARFDPQHTRLDLGRAPLLRAHLVEDARNGRWLLHILAHHLAIDHTTLDLLVEEAELIEQGRESELPAPVPFRHFVAQARLGVSQAEHEAFFTQMLGDIDEPTAPFGLLDVQGDGSGIEEARLRLDPALAQTVRAQARRLGVSAASLMHLAWSLVLARTTGRADVVFGTVLFGRMQGGEGADRVMGMFINTLPVRFSVDGSGVEAALRQTHARLAQLLRHEHAPLSLAQRCSAVEAPAPLFTSLLNYRYSPGMQAVLDGTAERDDEIVELGGHDRTNYPLTLSVDDLGQDFLLSAQAVAGLDPLRVCHFMQRALAGLADALARDPQRALNSLGILPEAERAQVVDGWNATHRPYALEQGTARLIEAQAARTPQAVALQQDETSLTYAELDARANRLAHHLRTLGVGPDVRVAVCLGRSVELVVAELAVLKAGGAYVPLDPAYPGERLAYMLEDCEPGVILTDGGLEAELQTLIAIAAARHEPALPVLDLRQDGAWRALPEDAVTVAGLRPHHLAYVIYTSGSTGRPKGVMIEQRSLNNLIGWHIERFGLEAGSRSSCTAGVAFDACAWETWPVLAAGGTLLLAPAASEGDPQALLAWWQSQALDVSFLVTPLAEHALAHGQANDGVRSLLIGGDRLRRWPSGLPSGQALVNNYGPTENTVVASSGTLSADGVLHIGRPIGNTRIYILDGHGQPVPIGVAGELYIGGDGVARGYLNQPELTAERFVADPFAAATAGNPAPRMYRTGDLGRWLADGTIEYLGRNDFQVKVRGFRIELGEIEAHLAQAADVSDVVVIARADGDTDTQHLVAYYVGEAAADALRTHAGDGLPSYMVPSAFVRLARLPLTPNGKLDRAALPAPEGDAFVRRGYEAPQGEVEQTLARLWSELLGVAQVGRHDNFFELGGHSLLAVQLVSRLRSEVALELSLSELFDTASLSELAARIEARRAAGEAGAVLEAIGRADRAAPLPLSLAQQRLWFLGRLGGASEAYHIAGAVALEGELDAAALAQALWRVQARHEALRTRFGVDGQGQPVQVIDGPDSALAWHTEDLSGLAGEAQDAALQASLGSEASAPFDLERGPLLRARLMRLGEGHHVLSLCMHHIISDGWSIGVLLDELSTQYGACVAGEDDPLPALAVQYADYAAWQRQWLSGGALAAQQAYWQATLAARPRLLSLPLDHARPAQQDYRGDTVPVWLPEALTQRLQALAQREGVTLYMVLLASWGVLLGRLAGQDEVVIGTPVAGRTRQEVEGLIGFFVNTLALPVDLRAAGAGEGQDEGAGEGPDTRDLLARVKAQVLGAQAHQALPFEQVVDLVQPPRSLSTTPLFQAVLAWQNTPEGELSLPGLTLRPLASPQATAQFDLTLNLMPLEGGVGGGLNYATALWSRATMERMVGGWQVLLEAMLSQPEVAVSRLAILPEAERAQVVDGWNATHRPYALEQGTARLIEAQAARTPQAVALQQDETSLTYAELDARANRLAHHLRTLGVGPDVRVAVCLGRSVELVVAELAVLKAGGAYVPLDPAYPGERLAYMLEDCEPGVILTDGGLEAELQTLIAIAAARHEPALPVLDLRQDGAWRALPEGAVTVAGLRPHHLAYVIYTSGSTGRPKGVMIEQRSLNNLIGWHIERFGLEAGSRSSCTAGVAFDACAWETWPVLAAGGTLLLAPAASEGDPQALLAWWQSQALDVSFLVTPLAEHALAHGQSNGGVRSLLIGGDRLRRWPSGLPSGQALVNNYGPTENTVVASSGTLSADGVLHIGRPIGNTRIYILDGHGQPVPIGVAGELYIGGDGVARGYLNQPELTAERFVADPFATATAGNPAPRMYKTGDLGRWLSDGTIEYLGRNDFQVKVRGFRIELGEIEAHLAQAADVSDVVVIARADGADDTQHLVAYYVGEAAAEALRAHAGDGLPSYMVPSAFVRLARLPLTPNGKLDRAALPAPEGDAFVRRGYEAPQGEVEQTLARLWSELLGVAQVGRHDNFFELGGHSLLAVSLIERMRQAGLQADVRALFTSTSLAELAASVGAGPARIEVPPNGIPADGSAERITPEMVTLAALTQDELDRLVAQVPGGVRNVQDIYPLAPLQEGILFHHLMAEDGDPYLLPSVYGFKQREAVSRFVDTVQQVIGRHDILRTAVYWEGLSQPVQVVQREARLELVELDAGDFGTADLAAALEARFDPQHTRLDLGRAPLLRAHLVEDARNGRWLLHILAHHLAIDHTTLELLVEEAELIEQGREAELPAPVPFRHFVAQARLGVSQEEHEAFFTQMLGDIDEPTAPFGLTEALGGLDEHHVLLPRTLAQSVRAQARRLGVSAASLMHLAWSLVLARTTGREDVVFGTVLFGRMQGGEGADRVMGMFINTLPVRLGIGDAGVEAALRQTHERLAQLLRHEHAPLALAQRCSAVQTPAPLFTSLLNYRHSAVAVGDAAADGVPAEGGNDVESLGASERTTYALTLTVDDLGEDFVLGAQVMEAPLAARVCGFMQRALEVVAAALERDPQQALRALDVLPASERTQVLEGWNATARDYPPGRCLHELIEAQVDRTPQAVAVRQDGALLTYAELNARANRLAHHLRTLGVGPDARVAVCLGRSVELVVALVAVLKAGGAYVPLDPGYPGERLAYMLEDCEPAVVISAAELAGRIGAERPGAVLLDMAQPSAWADASTANPEPFAGNEAHLAYVIYTSGSTGRPKAAQVWRRGLQNLLGWYVEDAGLSGEDRVLLLSSHSFDLTQKNIFGPLVVGGCLHLGAEPFDPQRILAQIEAEGITWLNLAPSAFHALIEAGAGGLQRLGTVVLGGEAVQAGRLQQIPSPRPRFINSYGPTECSDVVVWHGLEAELGGYAQGVPLGRPVRNTRLYVLDEHRAPVPIGVVGEIWIGGRCVGAGYLNQPELTAERFMADPFVTVAEGEAPARMYKTGDLGRWLSDGTIEYLGRNDFQVKVRGFRIELGEIEAHLAQCEGVSDVVVIARESGDGEAKHLVAYYVGDAAADALRTHAGDGLPSYMVPSAFVRLDRLPLTPNGKLDRAALPAPEGDAFVRRSFEAPQGDVEQTLARLWSELLGVEQVGRHDNFFELGGHSLLAVQLLVRLRQDFSVELSLSQVLAEPTVEALAKSVLLATVSHYDPNDVAQAMAELEGLSAEEIAALLASENED